MTAMPLLTAICAPLIGIVPYSWLCPEQMFATNEVDVTAVHSNTQTFVSKKRKNNDFDRTHVNSRFEDTDDQK